MRQGAETALPGSIKSGTKVQQELNDRVGLGASEPFPRHRAI